MLREVALPTSYHVCWSGVETNFGSDSGICEYRIARADIRHIGLVKARITLFSKEIVGERSD